MMIRSVLSFTLASTALATLFACTTAEESASTDLTTAESTLAGAADSLSSTQAAAEACFATFKTCADAATDDAAKGACREALKTCLPADAREPGKCAHPPRPPHARDDAGAGEPKGDRPPPPPRDLDDGEARSDGHDGQRPPPPPRDGDAGAPRDGDGHGGPGRGGPGGHGGGCKPPPVPRDRLEKCRDEASSSAADATSTATDHKKCVRRAFEDQIAEICSRAATECAKEGANADVCAAVTSLCDAAKADAAAAAAQ